MPMTVQDADGNEIEVYTADELEEQKSTVEAEKQAAIDALAAEREAEKEELEKLRNKDMNFENLRKSKEGKNNNLSQAEIERLDALEKRMNELASQPKLEVKEEFVQKYIGEDKEKRELFDYYFDKLAPENATKEQVAKAANDAMMLMSNGEYKPDGTAAMAGTSASQNYRNTAPKETSAAAKEMGALLGVTEDDRKKYGDK